MTSKQAIIQTSKPRIAIKRYSEAINAFQSIGERAVDAANENLLTYSWQMSVSDTQGSFTMTFFPAKTTWGEELFDFFKVMDVVEIYEEVLGTSSANLLTASKPCFVGVIRSKKYAAQMAESGVTRRVQISGISAAGLIAQLYVDFSVTTMAINQTFKANAAIQNQLTVDLLAYTGAEGKSKNRNTLDNVISYVWEAYKTVAREAAGKGTNRLLAMIDALGVKFDVEADPIEYPLANLLVAENTQNIFDITRSITPSPVYETFATIEDGVPVVKVRMVPFAASGWKELAEAGWLIEAVDCKAFDLTQSDETVYTVFYTYLDGYPLQEAKLITLSALLSGGKSVLENNEYTGVVKYNENKYEIYGFRLLNASFRGYYPTVEKDDEGNEKAIKYPSPLEMMKAMNVNMQQWFGYLDEMYRGSVSLAMTGSTSRITAGKVVSFLGGQFYVEGVAHSWEYGRGGDVNLSLTRGGNYKEGKFIAFTDFTTQTALLEGLAESARGAK